MKRRKKENTLKKVILTMTIWCTIVLVGFYLYTMYINIDISSEETSPYIASKTSQTIDQIQQESKTIADVVEEVSTAVVGISKLKENGNSIFLKDRSKPIRIRNRNDCIRRWIYLNQSTCCRRKI